MSYLKFQPNGSRLWSVLRGPEKIAEVAVDPSDKSARLIPVETFAYTLDELENISGFMLTASGRVALVDLHRPSPARGMREEDEIERAIRTH